MKKKEINYDECKKKVKYSKHYVGWYLFLRALFYPIARLFLRITVVGRQNLPRQGKYILAGNHRSWLDAPIIGFNTKGYHRYIMKNTFLKSRIMRWIVGKIGAFSVDRDKADLSIMRNVIGALNLEESVVIFPEGTRNHTDEQEFLELKNGVALFAIKTGANIVPIAFNREPKILKRTYMYVCEPIIADSGIGGATSREQLDFIAAQILEKMRFAHEDTSNLLASRQMRIRIKQDKMELKRIKKLNKANKINNKIKIEKT